MNVESAVTRGTKDKYSPSSRSLELNVGVACVFRVFTILFIACCVVIPVPSVHSLLDPQLPEVRKRHLHCLGVLQTSDGVFNRKTLTGLC